MKDKEKEESESGIGNEWSELTQECLINIFSRLSLEDRWRGAMLVCKTWLVVSKDSFLNSVFDLEAYFDSLTDSPRFWRPDFEQRIDYMLRSVASWTAGDLTEVRVRHCSDRSLSLVAERCPNLQVLSIKSSPNVSDGMIDKIANGCPQLRELDVSYCYEVSHKSLAAIGKHCPQLRIFRRNLMNWLDPSQHARIVPNEYLNAIPQDGDGDAAMIGKWMPHLLHLELRFSKMTARGLGLISGGCLNLEYLDLSGCANLTSRDIANASSNLGHLKIIKKPNFYIPRSVYHAERYGHWRLYDERFQTDIFRI